MKIPDVDRSAEETTPDVTGLRPERLDVRAFARQQAQLAGGLTAGQLPRLCLDLHGDVSSLVVRWSAQGVWRQIRAGAAQTWLQLRIEADLSLQCQRCLEAVRFPVDVDRMFRFVADEATAQALDEESEDDVLVASKTFDLFELIEDELLMALPIVPRHEVCPDIPVLPELRMGNEAESTSSAPHPFAVLGALRKPGMGK